MCASNVLLRERFDKRRGKVYNTLHFSTRSLPFFNLYYELFYDNKVKVVPSNIGILLSPIALGQWIMDDGSFKYGLTLQTNAFSVSDVELLISVLKSNYDIISHIRFERNQPIIYIPADQIDKLKLIVLSYMEPSTHYKLGL